jgi:hypothetical protein
MEMLEFFFEQKPKKQKLLPRKRAFPSANKVLVYGAPFSGKRSFILQNFDLDDKTLLIDTKDLRFDPLIYNQTIQAFIAERQIERLLIFDYTPNLFLPQCQQIVLSSSHPLSLAEFTSVRLDPLDFEEFLLFDRSNDPKVAFNNYLRYGTLPAIVTAQEKDRRYQELLRLEFNQEAELEALKEISFFLSQSASVYFIYTRLKERLKISKDRFYSLFEMLKEKGFVYTLPKFGSVRAAPKLYFFDFTLKNRLHIQKEFPKIFENMVFWQIRNKNLVYLDPLGLFDRDSHTLTLPIPFGNEVRIEEKINRVLAKSGVQPQRIEVVSVASEFEYHHGGIPVEVVPFYEWALR